MTYAELSKLVLDWRDMTFGDALSAARGRVASRAYEAVARAFAELRLADKQISGENFKGLSAIEAGNPLTLFSTAFNDTVLVADSPDRTPASYVAHWVERHDDYRNPRQLTGYVARALRAMPSFLREEGLAGDLSERLHSRGIPAEVIRDPQEDYNNHTDILVKVGPRTYRIWTFVFAEQSFNRTAMKLTGRLPAGIHILCPLELEDFARLETTHCTMEKKRRDLLRIEHDLTASSDTALCKRLSRRIQGRRATIDRVAAEHERLKQEFADSVRFVGGFFFYSADAAERLARIIASPGMYVDGQSVPRTKVIDLLSYLRRLNAFQVDQEDLTSS